MYELSKFLKVDSAGRLVTLDIKKDDGTVVIPSKENEEALIYTRMFDSINSAFKALWEIESEEMLQSKFAGNKD